MAVCEYTDSQGIFQVLRMAFQNDSSLSREPIYDKTDEEKIITSLQIISETGKYLMDKIVLLKGEKCAIWGCCAFTRGLLNYSKLQEADIVFFVDSNPSLLLQEKFTTSDFTKYKRIGIQE